MARFFYLLVAILFSASAQSSNDFPKPAELQRDVNFWIRIYSQVDTNSGLLHDPWDLSVVYGTVSLPAHGNHAERERLVNQAKARYQSALRQLAAGKRTALNAEEKAALNAWPKGTSSQRFRQAADEIRFQLGQSDRFKAGLVRSGQWRDHIRKALAEHGLPEELMVLPHVESSFNPSVYSRVAAAGMWQFMPATARQYMQVDHLMDERLDPYISTHAAAKLLKNNYRITGTWPLALTAYNHGAGGISRGAAAMGTKDIATIVRKYRGPSFGFASRNFYVSFLAALEVDRNASKYFGQVALASPIDYDRVTLQDYIHAAPLAQAMNTDVATLRLYNPALLDPVWTGEKRIPKGFALKFPRSGLKQPLAQAIASMPSGQRYAYQQPDVLHRIARGETLSHVARRYNTSVKELMSLNGLKNHNIRAGRELRLPGRVTADAQSRVASTTTSGSKSSGSQVYVIKPGDSIWGIARRFNRTEKELLAWNNLSNKHKIMPGDTLRIAMN